jgi:hypothetical protein
VTDAAIGAAAVFCAGIGSMLVMLLAAEKVERVGIWFGRAWRWTARHEAAIGAGLAIVTMTLALGCMVLG